MSQVRSKSELSKSQELWFDDFIGTILMHRVALEKGVASQNIKDIYSAIWKDGVDLAKTVRASSTESIVKALIFDFLEKVLESDPKFVEIAFDLSQDKVLAWFIIKADDWETEENIILAAAKSNAKFYKDTGICIEPIVVEDIDNIPIPSHYQKVIIHNKED